MNKSTIVVAIAMLTVGLAAGYWFAPGTSASLPTAAVERQPLFYRNPMNPMVTSPVPAKDSMGMDYVPVYADNDSDSSDSAGTVKVDPTIAQNMGVRTSIARRDSITRSIRAVARVAYDEASMTRLHPKVEGWIEYLGVDKTGDYVEKGQVLLGIYSPKLVSTQQEYLLALNNLQTLKSSPFEDIRRGAEDLVDSSRERLRLLDVAEHQISELERTREVRKVLNIHSPVGGTVINIGAREGQYVTPKTELYMIVDLSTVWVYADIYEYELPWVKVGDEVEMTLAGVPGRTFVGELEYVYPYAEARTRSIKVRISFDNSEQLLKPEMFAAVVIKSDMHVDAIVIPAEAVVRSGKNERVFIARGSGKFEPVLVKLGIQSGGRVAVLEGIKAGDEIVVSAQFLLDSESSLREATAKMIGLPQTEPMNHAAGEHADD